MAINQNFLSKLGHMYTRFLEQKFFSRLTVIFAFTFLSPVLFVINSRKIFFCVSITELELLLPNTIKFNNQLLVLICTSQQDVKHTLYPATRIPHSASNTHGKGLCLFSKLWMLEYLQGPLSSLPLSSSSVNSDYLMTLNPIYMAMTPKFLSLAQISFMNLSHILNCWLDSPT